MKKINFQGRPIGSRVYRACELLEQHGPMVSVKVGALMGASISVTNYLNRAESYGCVTADRSEWQAVYTVTSNWRELICLRKHARPIPLDKPMRPVNCVWALGVAA